MPRILCSNRCMTRNTALSEIALVGRYASRGCRDLHPNRLRAFLPPARRGHRVLIDRETHGSSRSPASPPRQGGARREAECDCHRPPPRHPPAQALHSTIEQASMPPRGSIRAPWVPDPPDIATADIRHPGFLAAQLSKASM